MRGRYYAAFACFGIALGAVVYRYGMLPFGWTSSARHVFVGGAIGLAVAGYQLIKDAGAATDAKRPAVPLLLAVGAAGVLAAFGVCYLAFPSLNRAPIERRELPGFSLAVPKGTIVDDSFVYGNGRLTINNAGGAGGVVLVQWQADTPMTADDLKIVASMLGNGLGKRLGGEPRIGNVPGPDGKPLDTIFLEGDGFAMSISALTCGIRQVLVATGGGSTTTGLHQRIVASFQCKADPKQEATANNNFPIFIELPGWYVMVREPGQLQITDGATGVLTLRTVPNVKGFDPADVLAQGFKAAGIEMKMHERVGDRIPITLAEDGESIEGWVTLKRCPSNTAMVLGIADTREQLDDLYTRVDAARCLRPGEPAQEWPDSAPAAPLPD